MPWFTRSTTAWLTSTPTTSWPLLANWTASGRPIFPRAITVIFMARPVYGGAADRAGQPVQVPSTASSRNPRQNGGVTADETSRPAVAVTGDPRPYQRCVRTVMDTTDADIWFDDEGVSS